MEALLAKKLKAFQKDFRSTHGREPKRSDIAKVPEMAAVYDTWMAMSGTAAAKGREQGKDGQTSKARGEKALSASSGNMGRSGSNEGIDNPNTRTMGLSPATPTKARRSSGHEPAVSSSSSSLPPAVPQTPSRGFPSSSRLPSTPSTSSQATNPFKTPTKPATQHPSTPGSGIKLRTPPVALATSPSSHSALNNVDSRFHYNLSPSSFRKLVADLSPRKGVSNVALARPVKEQVYTPRTKARKRLRGEEVPPTPRGASSSGEAMSPSKHSSSSSLQRTSSGQDRLLAPESALDHRPPKRRASSRSERELGPLWGRSESDSAALRPGYGVVGGPGGGNLFSRTASAGSQPLQRPASNTRADTPLLRLSPPPSDPTDRSKMTLSPLPVNSTENALPSTEQPRSGPQTTESHKGRKFRSLFDDLADDDGGIDVSDVNDGMDLDESLKAATTASLSAQSSGPKTSKLTKGSRSSKPPSRITPVAPLLLDALSSEESDTGAVDAGNRKTSSSHPSPSKTVFLRAYQRFGNLNVDRSRGNDHDGEGSDTSSDEEGPLSLGLLSPRKRRGVAQAAGGGLRGRLSPVSSLPRLRSATSDLSESDKISWSSLSSHPFLSTQGSANPSHRHRSDLLISRRLALSCLLDDSSSSSSPLIGGAQRVDNDSMVKEVERELEEQRAYHQSSLQSHFNNNNNNRSGKFGKVDDRKTWGGAKAANRQAAGLGVKGGRGRRGGTGLPNGSSGDVLLGKARRGMGDSLGTFSDGEEEEARKALSGQVGGHSGGPSTEGDASAQGAVAAAQKQLRRSHLIFKRMGRSGVDDAEDEHISLRTTSGNSKRRKNALDDLGQEWADVVEVENGEEEEEIDRRRQSEDEDWASDVDEDQWGWGGELEETDVV